MGMSAHTFETICKLKEKLTKPNLKLLFLSYPDLLFDKSILPKSIKKIKYRDDSEEILRWHKGYKFLGKIIETVDIFEQLGFQVTVLDIVRARGCEILCDLNEHNAISGEYDIIFDNVLQHVFNCGEAIKSIAQSCKVGGYIYHLNSYMMPNHGFHNFSPEFYSAFYKLNGFEITSISVSGKTVNIKVENKGPDLSRIPQKCKIEVIVKRKYGIFVEQNWQFPIQQKFIDYPNSKK